MCIVEVVLECLHCYNAVSAIDTEPYVNYKRHCVKTMHNYYIKFRRIII